jgi:hypothetical protein
MIVPTLRVVTQRMTLRVILDAERPGRHSHAERGNDQISVFAVDLDLASKRAEFQTTPIATWVQAERRWRVVGRAAWMPREPPPAMDGGWRRAHGASPSLRNGDEGAAKPGARKLGYLVSFQVTRRRRNRSGVSQTPSAPPPIQEINAETSATKNSNPKKEKPRQSGALKNRITRLTWPDK